MLRNERNKEGEEAYIRREAEKLNEAAAALGVSLRVQVIEPTEGHCVAFAAAILPAYVPVAATGAGGPHEDAKRDDQRK